MMRAPLAALILATILATSGGALVQAQPLGESILTASITQTFEADSNYSLQPDPSGASFFSDTRFGLGLTKETSTQRFTLGVNAGLRALWRADQSFQFTYANPTTARASYRQDWADASLGGYLRYSLRRLSTLLPVDDGFEFLPVFPDDLTRFDGNEQRIDAGFDLALRTDSPSSYRIGVDATDFRYSDIPASEQENTSPRTQLDASAAWTLRLNPVLSSVVLATYEYGKAENTLENEIVVGSIDAGVIYDLYDTANIAAGIGYADRTQTNTIGGERVEIAHDRGPLVRGAITYELSDFTLRAAARVTTAAPETRWTGDLLVRYNLLRGNIFARGYRSYNGNSAGDEVLNNGAILGLTHEINSLSQWGVNLNAANQSNIDDPTVPDVNQMDLTARYNYDLTADVAATLGYRFRLRDSSSDSGSAQSNAIFITFGRTWSRRP